MKIDLIKDYYASIKTLNIIEDYIKEKKDSFFEGRTSTDNYNNGFNFPIYEDGKDKVYTQTKISNKINYDLLKNDYPNLIVEIDKIKSTPKLIKSNPEFTNSLKEETFNISLKQTLEAKNDKDVLFNIDSNLYLNQLNTNSITIPKLIMYKDELKDQIKKFEKDVLKTLLLNKDPILIKEIEKFLIVKSKNDNVDISDFVFSKKINDFLTEHKIYDWKDILYVKSFDDKATIKNLEENNIDLNKYVETNETKAVVSLNDTTKCDRMFFGANIGFVKEAYLNNYISAIEEHSFDLAEKIQESFISNKISFETLNNILSEFKNNELDINSL